MTLGRRDHRRVHPPAGPPGRLTSRNTHTTQEGEYQGPVEPAHPARQPGTRARRSRKITHQTKPQASTSRARGVGDWRGGSLILGPGAFVAAGFPVGCATPVSLARSAPFPVPAASNRACGSPAHGSPTPFTAGIRLSPPGEAAALPITAGCAVLRLNRYYGRLRRPPGQPSTSRGHRLQDATLRQQDPESSGQINPRVTHDPKHAPTLAGGGPQITEPRRPR